MGCAALGVETGIWFAIKLQNQSAADAAALSAVHEVIAGKSMGELLAAASKAGARNGYRGSTPTVVYPYDDGTVSNAVAVTLQQREGALLAAMFLSAVTVATKAVAVIEVLDNPCLLALGTTARVSKCRTRPTSTRPAAPSQRILSAGTRRPALEHECDRRGDPRHAGEASFQALRSILRRRPRNWLGITREDRCADRRRSLFRRSDPCLSDRRHTPHGQLQGEEFGPCRSYEGHCIVDGSSLNQSRNPLCRRAPK